jgi:hypothetical protein
VAALLFHAWAKVPNWIGGAGAFMGSNVQATGAACGLAESTPGLAPESSRATLANLGAAETVANS